MMPAPEVFPSHIVLIEDNPGDVLLVETALQESGIAYHLTQFNNGIEAVRVLCGPGEHPPVPDAILLDLNTPRSDGFEVLITLRQSPRLSQVPIAIITSSEAASDKHRCAQQHIRYIHKESQVADFLATVGLAVKEMLHA